MEYCGCQERYCYDCLPFDEKEDDNENEDWKCGICIKKNDKLNTYSGLKKDLLKLIKDSKLNKSSIRLIQQYIDELVENNSNE
jgi:hypothetical protein